MVIYVSENDNGKFDVYKEGNSINEVNNQSYQAAMDRASAIIRNSGESGDIIIEKDDSQTVKHID